MTRTQYKSMVQSTLDNAPVGDAKDSAVMAQAIFDNCGVAFPKGGIREILATLSSNNYMGWRNVSYAKAQEKANNGTATVGVDDERIVVIMPEAETNNLDSVAAKPTAFTAQANAIPTAERTQMQYFSNIAAACGGGIGSLVTSFPSYCYGSPTNVYAAKGSGFIGQCTTYCWGRAYEKKGVTDMPNCMAYEWLSKAPTKYTQQYTPAPNSIAVYANDSYTNGHVAYIEDVLGGYMQWSEANWPAHDSGSWWFHPVYENGILVKQYMDGVLQQDTVSSFTGRIGSSTLKLVYRGCIVLK